LQPLRIGLDSAAPADAKEMPAMSSEIRRVKVNEEIDTRNRMILNLCVCLTAAIRIVRTCTYDNVATGETVDADFQLVRKLVIDEWEKTATRGMAMVAKSRNE
jgi:hypothetical protein